jgi:hypothetical protein
VNPLAFFIFIAFAYLAGRKIALYQAKAGQDGYTMDVQMAAAARLFVEAGIIIAVFIAAFRSLTPNP